MKRILESVYRDDEKALRDDASLALFLSVMGSG
jgi:hypothetical protein